MMHWLTSGAVAPTRVSFAFQRTMRRARQGGRTLFALAALSLMVGCGVTPPNPPGPPVYTIAFVTNDGQIATMTPGGQPTIVSPPLAGATGSTPRRYAWPTWSLDGRRIAFQAIDGGVGGAVLVVEPTGANRVIVQEMPAGAPIFVSWSPDGQALAMLFSGEETLHLMLGRSDGRGSARRLASGQPLFSTWAADSTALAVHAGGDSFTTTTGRLAIVPVANDAAEDLIDVDPELFRVPAWSPGGAHVAVAGDTKRPSSGLMLRDRDGSLRHFADLTGPPAMIWSPSGDRLAWSSLDGPPFAYNGIFVATPDGQPATRIVDERLFAFAWSPDGQQMAYFTVDEAERSLNLRVVSASGGVARTVFALEPSREFIQYLTFFDQYAPTNSIWSPDSRALIVGGWLAESDTSAPPTMYIVPADGSAPAQALGPGRLGFFAPSTRSAPTGGP